MTANIVEMKGISKSFPGVQALSNVDFDVRPGEVHALVGENGAGKSTVIKILMGVHSKTKGEIYLDGNAVEIKSPLHAQSLGLGAVYQDVNLAQHLSVAENLFMGRLPKNKFGIIDHKTMHRETKEIMDSIEVFVEPQSIVKNLSVAQQEMVAIGKMLHQKARVVIFDEPTALLTNDEAEQLFRIIGKLKASGVAILYISHRLEEIFRLCDRATVLKDGVKVGTVDTTEITEDKLISMMVGRDVEDMYNIEHAGSSETALCVNQIGRNGAFADVSFEVKKGEIFGMFGLVGSGRTEIARSIFGADQKDNGTVTLFGKKANFVRPIQGIRAGIALLPEDRKTQGLAMGLSVNDNINMASMRQISSFGILDNKKGEQISEEYCQTLRTKTPSIHQLVKNLSGGNQQKVVISKWLAAGSDLFIFDEPTVGIDVGAKFEIYKVFESLINEGKTVIVISSYLPEVMGLSDRILVMYEGRQMGILNKEEFDEERILRLASGIKERGTDVCSQ